MMVRLQRERISGFMRDRITVITASLPFVYSRNGEYAHRVRSGLLINCAFNNKAHMAYHCWCGMSLLSMRARLSASPDGRPICATCDGRAIGAGMMGAAEIAGHPVIFRPRVFRATGAATP